MGTRRCPRVPCRHAALLKALSYLVQMLYVYWVDSSAAMTDSSLLPAEITGAGSSMFTHHNRYFLRLLLVLELCAHACIRLPHSLAMWTGINKVLSACSVYVFGGMDDERAEQMSLCRWDLSKEEGFEHVHYRSAVHRTLLLYMFSTP